MYRVLKINFQWCQTYNTRTCIYPISFNNTVLSISGIDPGSDLKAAQCINLYNHPATTSLSQFQYFEANVMSDTLVEVSVTEGLFTIIGY